MSIEAPRIDLTDQTAIVTGGSRGIGLGVCRALGSAGARVAMVATNPERTEEAAGQLRDEGLNVEPHTLDVADTDAVTALVTSLHKEWGRLDILVNNAGITRDGVFMRMSDEDFDRVVAVDLRGVFAFCRAAARPMMKARKGRIINVTSIVGLMGNAGQVNYAAAKAGVVGLTKSLAKELGGRGINVNALAPGFIDTDMTSGLPDDVKEASLKGIPMGRFGKSEDIAHGVAFLASDLASYITGQTLVVDGGMYI